MVRFVFFGWAGSGDTFSLEEVVEEAVGFIQQQKSVDRFVDQHEDVLTQGFIFRQVFGYL